jgi:hypothetical protein
VSSEAGYRFKAPLSFFDQPLSLLIFLLQDHLAFAQVMLALADFGLAPFKRFDAFLQRGFPLMKLAFEVSKLALKLSNFMFSFFSGLSEHLLSLYFRFLYRQFASGFSLPQECFSPQPRILERGLPFTTSNP